MIASAIRFLDHMRIVANNPSSAQELKLPGIREQNTSAIPRITRDLTIINNTATNELSGAKLTKRHSQEITTNPCPGFDHQSYQYCTPEEEKEAAHPPALRRTPSNCTAAGQAGDRERAFGDDEVRPSWPTECR